MKKSVLVIGVVLLLAAALSITLFLSSSKKDDDFQNVKSRFQSGEYNLIVNLSKEYYMKPEFYPSYTGQNGSGKGKYGYGAYPGDVSYNTAGFQKGQQVEVYTFIHTSFDVNSYQTIIPAMAYNSELFEVSVEPSNLVLSPVFEAGKLTQNWTYKTKVTITAKQDIPEGKYLFKMSAPGGFIQPGKFFDFTLYNERGMEKP